MSLTVIVSRGRSANPKKRKLEDDLVAAFEAEPGIQIGVVPHLYDLKPGGEGFSTLAQFETDLVVCGWMYARAIHWVLDRNGVPGTAGETLLESADEDGDDLNDEMDGEGGDAAAAADEKHRVINDREAVARTIYSISFRDCDRPAEIVAEVCRLRDEPANSDDGAADTSSGESESHVGSPEHESGSSEAADDNTAHTTPAAGDVGHNIFGWLQGAPRDDQLERFANPTNTTSLGPASDANASSSGGSNGGSNGGAAAHGNAIANGSGGVLKIEENAGRRWYPVIDFTRCTNCLECLDFCLFGVYGIDRAETILVEQPDNCRKGCPACSRVCPENAILFPEHKTPAIAGSPVGAAGALKIDLSKLFGAPEADAMDVAVEERDRELEAAGRDVVGMSVGIPKRQPTDQQQPKDELDSLMDQLDEMEL